MQTLSKTNGNSATVRFLIPVIWIGFLEQTPREPLARIMFARQAQRKGEPEIKFTRNQLNLNADVIIEFKN